ncbi:MAG: Imm49 family immunity protein [Bacteroidota bacterium]
MDDLEKRYSVSSRVLQAIASQAQANGVDNILAGNLYNEHLFLAIYELIKNSNVHKAKLNFYICGRLDEHRIKKFNNRLLDYGIPNICGAVLSDSAELCSSYANLSYRGDGKHYSDMSTMVGQGEIAIYCHTIQLIIKDDWNNVARNLEIMETVTLPKTKHPVMKLDFEFYKAIYEKNLKRAEEIISELVTPKVHKQRNDSPLLSKYISQPALGYAKLAWMKGLEVRTNSDLIPAALLPIKPLQNYSHNYTFLKETD